MKIVFICSTLEIGKDGVGDYCRLLATEFIKTGNQVLLISLSDKHIKKNVEEQQCLKNIKIHAIRLPFNDGYKKNSPIALKYIKNFNPDWISLQFVPFGFHPKGLPFSFPRYFENISIGFKLHIMFHELWVGMENNATKKMKIWGYFQSLIIKRLIRKSNPLLLHTNTKLYEQKLYKLGFKANCLPIISNIDFEFSPDPHTDLKSQIDDRTIKLVFFGNIHQGAPIKKFSCELDKYLKDNNMFCEISFLGNNGKELEKLRTIFLYYGFKVKIHGEKNAEFISSVLKKSDLGISTTPYILRDKSGTIAAMREHGLPVLCVSRNWDVDYEYIDSSENDFVHNYKENIISSKFMKETKETKSYRKYNLKTLFNDFYKSLKIFM